MDVANRWPSDKQLATADVLVFYQQGEWNDQRAKDLDAFQLVEVAPSIRITRSTEAVTRMDSLSVLDLPGKEVHPSFRHGPLDLHFERGSSHPIARNFDRVKFVDETYWQLLGDRSVSGWLRLPSKTISPQPIFWTVEKTQPLRLKKQKEMKNLPGSWFRFWGMIHGRLMTHCSECSSCASVAWAGHEPVIYLTNTCDTRGSRRVNLWQVTALWPGLPTEPPDCALDTAETLGASGCPG